MYWLDRYVDLVTLTYIVHSSDLDTFYIDVRYLLKYKAWQVPWPSDLDLYLTHFTLMFDNSSTIRPTTTIPCIVLLLDVLN